MKALRKLSSTFGAPLLTPAPALVAPIITYLISTVQRSAARLMGCLAVAAALVGTWGGCATTSAAAWTDLRATVRLGSGMVHWQNTGSEDLQFTGYTLFSASGSLRPNQWQPVTDRLDQDGDGSFDSDGSWLVLSPLQPFPTSATDLSEGVVTGDGGVLAPGQMIGLGRAWNPSGSLDLELFASDAMPGVTPIDVYYLPAGDFNLDGLVDIADYTVWRNSVGQTGLGLLADANGDGAVNGDDYTLWKASFGQTQFVAPAAVAIAPALVAVPEPALRCALLTLAGLILWTKMPRRC